MENENIQKQQKIKVIENEQKKLDSKILKSAKIIDSDILENKIKNAQSDVEAIQTKISLQEKKIEMLKTRN